MPKAAEPRVFSADHPDPHTTALPASIRRLLERDPGVADSMSSQSPAPTRLPEDWTLCYRVSLGSKDETDYIVQGNHELMGANVTRFWVFRMVAGAPRLILATGGLTLSTTTRRSHELLEIRTGAVTMMQAHTQTYRFDGIQYVSVGAN
jgi:hypothetical protein